MPKTELLIASQVARRLGVSTARIHQLDERLAPEREALRGWRVYRADVVEAYAAERRAARGSK